MLSNDQKYLVEQHISLVPKTIKILQRELGIDFDTDLYIDIGYIILCELIQSYSHLGKGKLNYHLSSKLYTRLKKIILKDYYYNRLLWNSTIVYNQKIGDFVNLEHITSSGVDVPTEAALVSFLNNVNEFLSMLPTLDQKLFVYVGLLNISPYNLTKLKVPDYYIKVRAHYLVDSFANNYYNSKAPHVLHVDNKKQSFYFEYNLLQLIEGNDI